MADEHKSFNERARTTVTFIFVFFIIGSLLLGTSRWEVSPLVEESLMLAGCFFAGVGAFGRVWCSLYIAGYKNNKLVTSGPYALCRNPLYFFSFLGGTGVALATECFTLPLLVILAFASYYPAVIAREKKRLQELFGEEYDRYCQNVPSFFPRLGKRISEPDTYVVNPKVFSHNIIDALWFIWIIGILEFISALHDTHILPTLYRLY